MAKTSIQSQKDDQLKPATSYVMFTENTDGFNPPVADAGLIKTRKDRILASLGSNAEMISIVVQGYNRLEKTRNCVESILKYTTGHDFELILVDNGSTDGTLEYYQSVVCAKKKIVRVTKNVGSVVPVMKYIDGRYVAYICNDTYVTQNWIENLLACLKSDDAIGMVVPLTSNGSNLQGIDLPFSSLEEMYEKAAAYNHSDPGKWHERLRLVVQMAVYKREALDVAGVLLDYGYYHDFADDDITFRIRRTGYKTILCKDTFVHHDHIRKALSAAEAEDFNRSIAAGKRDFGTKFFGLDAWTDVNNYEPTLMSFVDPGKHDAKMLVKALGVDVLCGTPILELKNKLRENHLYDVELSAFSTHPKYWLDLKTICSGKVFVDRIEHIGDHFNQPIFDYVFLDKPVNLYANPETLLQAAFSSLKPGGVLLLKLKNAVDFITLFHKLGINITVADDNPPALSDLTIDGLLLKLDQIGFRNPKLGVENWAVDPNQIQMIKNTIISNQLSDNIDASLKTLLIKDFCVSVNKT